MIAFGLEMKHAGVSLVLLQQLFVGTSFGNLTLVNDINIVLVSNSGKTMRDENDGFVFYYLVDLVENFAFGLGIDGRCWFIQDDDGSIAEISPGEGDFLPLAGG